MVDKTIEVTVHVRTDKVGSDCEHTFCIDQSEWNEMSDEQKEKECKEYASNMFEWWFETN